VCKKYTGAEVKKKMKKNQKYVMEKRHYNRSMKQFTTTSIDEDTCSRDQ
jgi:hypothetical protein